MAGKSANGLCRLVMLALLLATPSSAAWAQYQIYSCGTTLGAGTWTLANDLLNCPGDGIDIEGSRVTVELGSHKITGSGTGTGINVSNLDQEITGVLIRGSHATITNFDKGIELVTSEGGAVIEVTCTGNNIGFSIKLGLGNMLGADAATMNHSAGFMIDDIGGTYQDNVSTQNSNGFVLYDHAGANYLESNTADRNANYGIVAESGTHENNINGNEASGNHTYDLADENGHCANTWKNNKFGTRNLSCID